MVGVPDAPYFSLPPIYSMPTNQTFKRRYRKPQTENRKLLFFLTLALLIAGGCGLAPQIAPSSSSARLIRPGCGRPSPALKNT